MGMRINILIVIGFLAFGCKNGYEPYKEKSLNSIYNSLFCDNIDLYKSDTSSKRGYPWDVILSDKFSAKNLYKVADDFSLETRLRILALNRLRDNKVMIVNKELLGVIIEIGTDNGIDVTAAYKDGRARHINQSGKMIVWENRDNTSDSLINQLFMKSEAVVKQIGPWNKPRLDYPAKDSARITFLVSDGLYYGQGFLYTVLKDPMVGPVLETGGELVKYLMIKAEK